MTDDSFLGRAFVGEELEYRAERARLAAELAWLKLERRQTLTASAGYGDARLEEIDVELAELDQAFVASALRWHAVKEDARRIAREAQGRTDAAHAEPVELTSEEFKVEVDRLLAGVFEDVD